MKIEVKTFEEFEKETQGMDKIMSSAPIVDHISLWTATLTDRISVEINAEHFVSDLPIKLGDVIYHDPSETNLNVIESILANKKHLMPGEDISDFRFIAVIMEGFRETALLLDNDHYLRINLAFVREDDHYVLKHVYPRCIDLCATS